MIFENKDFLLTCVLPDRLTWTETRLLSTSGVIFNPVIDVAGTGSNQTVFL